MPSANKNECPTPGCVNLKTSWSDKCADCEHERKRLSVATERRDDDLAFLTTYQGWTLSQIASERHISRERARQLLAKARARLHYLEGAQVAAHQMV